MLEFFVCQYILDLLIKNASPTFDRKSFRTCFVASPNFLADPTIQQQLLRASSAAMAKVTYEYMNPNYKESLEREWWTTSTPIMPAEDILDKIKNQAPAQHTR